ncbi:MAG: pyridoxamine 5'-phosphate oxidase family protein [Acidobacteriota bacterium]|nr:pyridoxamine 5'-phosphate oxidase family protein [Acidobacteriota bacterium]
MTRGGLYQFIAAHDLAVVSSLSSEGSPECALVGIAVTPDLEIVFDTVNSSRKYKNLLHDPRTALVIGWENEITVQYEGLAREIAGPADEHYKEVYFNRWPECREHQNWAGIAYFVIRPKWIRYSEFNEGSRGIFEFTW